MFKFLIILVYLVVTTTCACTLPVSWDGQWWDSESWDLTFSHSTQTLSGWRLQVFAIVITDWTCVNQNSSNYLLFRANQYLSVFGLDYVPYRCVRYVQITENSYYYYILADENWDSNYARYHLNVVSGSLSDSCQPTNGPSAEEYHVLIKKGYESSVKQWCPIPLLGTFSYTHYNEGVTRCGAGSVVSACPDWTELRFKYSQCPTTQVFSASGIVQCVTSIEYNSTIYTTVFNPETVTDTTNYDKFTCLAISKVGKTLYISDAKGSCVKGQTATVKTSTGSGTLVLSTYSPCCEYQYQNQAKLSNLKLQSN